MAIGPAITQLFVSSKGKPLKGILKFVGLAWNRTWFKFDASGELVQIKFEIKDRKIFERNKLFSEQLSGKIILWASGKP